MFFRLGQEAGDTFTLEVPRWLYDYFSLGVVIIH